MALEMNFYNEVNSKLKKYISHYWIAYGELEPNETLKIIPIDHIDMIIPIHGQYYVNENRVFEHKTEAFFSGIMDAPIMVTSCGYIQLFGISFTPWGFYPIVRQDLSKYRNHSVDISSINNELARKLKSATNQLGTKISTKIPNEYINLVETSLLEVINFSSNNNSIQDILIDLCSSREESITVIKKKYNLSNKSLERLFNKYIGIAPRKFYKIQQFHDASRKVLNNMNLKLTNIAYNSNYYDQAHFTKAFKKYANETPTSVRNKKSILKSRLKYK